MNETGAITARNYAAQARMAAESIARQFPQNRAAIDMARIIPESQHFAIPDGGKLLNDGLRGLDGGPVRLPFASVTVECWCDGTRYCTTASQDGGAIVMLFAISLPGRDWIVPNMACLLESVGDGVVSAKFVGGDADNLQEQPIFQFMVLTALELCEALSCSNVESEPIEQIDARKNAKRIKQGKVPLYETRRLVVKASKRPSRRDGASDGDSARSTPREHLRRGHIRRLDETRRIWVNACVVGSRERGVIEKRYSVIM